MFNRKECPIVSLDYKVEILRRLETFSYQVAYFILEDEGLAIDATKRALIEVSLNADFYRQSLSNQRETLRKLTIRQSLAPKTKTLLSN